MTHVLPYDSAFSPIVINTYRFVFYVTKMAFFQIVELLKLRNLFKDMYSVVLCDKSNGKNMHFYKQRNVLNCTFVAIRERVK